MEASNPDMDTTKIRDALQAAEDTNEFLIQSGCIAETPAVFRRLFGDAKAVVVADEVTFEAAGRTVGSSLRSENVDSLEPFIFPGKPRLHPDYEHITRLKEFLSRRGVIPIAVGSGTINDIVKLASHESGRRYMVVATAASVDGYTSFGAAIVMGGYKKTVSCPAPLGIIADTEVLRRAPMDMTSAGYADLVSKVTSGADWIIADRLGLDPIHPVSYYMVQRDLRKWIARPQELLQGDTQAFEYLFEGLALSGFAMQALRRTRAASGAEHLFSHIWEMQNLEVNGETVSHGFKVALGTLAATALMEVVFSRDTEDLDTASILSRHVEWEERESEIRETFAAIPSVEDVVTTCREKHLTGQKLEERIELIRANWETMRREVSRQMLPYAELKELLMRAACPVEPGQINLTRKRVMETFFSAQMIRNRYTILDLAFDLGWLSECVREISNSKTYL